MTFLSPFAWAAWLDLEVIGPSTMTVPELCVGTSVETGLLHCCTEKLSVASDVRHICRSLPSQPLRCCRLPGSILVVGRVEEIYSEPRRSRLSLYKLCSSGTNAMVRRCPVERTPMPLPSHRGVGVFRQIWALQSEVDSETMALYRLAVWVAMKAL